MSLHGHEGEATTQALNLVPQDGGTYAGRDVPFGTVVTGAGDAYPWLYDIRRDEAPPPQWVVDWRIDPKRLPQAGPPEAHLRLWFLTQVADVALASGDPPQNKSRNPRRLTYVLPHTAGEALQSTFVSVLEPYAETAVVADVKRLEVRGGGDTGASAAVRVTLADGGVDYLLTCDDPSSEITVADGPTLAGALGFLRLRDGVVEQAALIGGTRLSLGAFGLTAESDAHEGVIDRFDREMDDDNRVYTAASLPEDDLVGEEIIIQNDRARNACYRIHKIERENGRTEISLGDVTFVRGFADPRDYDSGYAFNFAPGDPFRIPNHVCAMRHPNGVWEIAATCVCELSVPDTGG